ncbi:MAG: hypothetical protein K9N07_10530 [Candidatus Cloacimonetes bacterium]|nr:hypothetical protein [Candidatus Cloacimonadota bacterium]
MKIGMIEDALELIMRICFILSEWQPTYYIVFGLFVVLLMVISYREIKSRKNCWLSSRIEKAKIELKGIRTLLPWHKKLLQRISQWYYPTAGNFAAMTILLALSFSFLNKHFYISYENAEFYRTLVPVQIGIVALIFPIMIFIIGFSGNKMASGVNLSEVLLKESFLFPVGLVGLFFLVNLIWARSSCVIVIQIFVSAIMYAAVLFQIIRVLLSDKRLLDKSKALLKDKLRRSIENTIEERLGNNILMKELGENKIELEYTLFDPEREKEECVNCEINQRGVVCDINLDNLKKIAQIIETASKKNGLSFYANILDLPRDNNVDLSSIEGSTGRAKTLKQEKGRYLRKRFFDEITDDRPSVFSFKKILIQGQCDIQEIQLIANTTFRVRRNNDEDNQLRTELRNLKDQLIDDIKAKHLGRISSLREVYISLSELFLDIMKSYSSNYSMEMAKKERSNIVGEWAEVQWITDDLRDIYSIAMQSQDKNVIREIAYLPIAISHRAIRQLDHYIFEKTFGFIYLLYMHACKEKDKDLQEFMKDRCGTYIRETADYAIQYELGKIGLGKDRVSHYRDFCIEIFMQLQHLLKQAYDAKDLQTFSNAVSIGKKLFSHFKPSERHSNAESLEWRLKSLDLTDKDKQKLQKELDEKQFLEKIEKDINQKKNEMFFGLVSFILDEYRSQMNDDVLKFYQIIQTAIPDDIKHLTDIYIKCHSFDAEHFWGWHWWILPLDGEAHFIDFKGKLDFLYAVKLLNSIEKKSEQVITGENLPYTRDYIYLVEKEDSPIRKNINDLTENHEKWKGIVSQQLDSAKKKALFDLFDKAKANQKKEEEDSLIEAKLSQAKTQEFIGEFKSGYNSNAGMNMLFRNYGVFKDDTMNSYAGDILSKGYNRLDEKGAFLDEWHVHYSRWGEQYGSGIANSENSDLFEKICESLNPIEREKINLFDCLEKEIDNLDEKKYTANVIISSLDFSDHRLLSGDKRFVPHWNKDCPANAIPYFHGVFKYKNRPIPVIRLYRQKKKGFIGVFDLKKFAVLTQLNPLSNNEDKKYRVDQFYINIIDLSEDDNARNDIIQKNPDWLKKYEDKERFLKTKVIIKTFMRQDMQIVDKKAAVLINIGSDKKNNKCQ